MGRTRSLKYDAFLDEDLSQLPAYTRLCFLGLPTIADKEGRLEDRPMKIKAQLFPYEDVDVAEMLHQLAKPRVFSEGPFIYRYSVNGKSYIQIVNFLKHQRPHPNEKASVIPEPPEDVKSNYIKLQAIELPSGSGSGSQDLPGSGALTEREAAASPPTRRRPVYWEPKPTWKPEHPSLKKAQLKVEPSHLEQLAEDFPDVDVRAEIRCMKSYALENPSWARIKRNWQKVLGSWIRRSDERLHDGRFKARASPTERLVAQEKSWQAGEGDQKESIAACEKEHGPHDADALVEGNKTRYCIHSCGYYLMKEPVNE